jgi:hypothetical protein
MLRDCVRPLYNSEVPSPSSDAGRSVRTRSVSRRQEDEHLQFRNRVLQLYNKELDETVYVLMQCDDAVLDGVMRTLVRLIGERKGHGYTPLHMTRLVMLMVMSHQACMPLRCLHIVRVMLRSKLILKGMAAMRPGWIQTTEKQGDEEVLVMTTDAVPFRTFLPHMCINLTSDTMRKEMFDEFRYTPEDWHFHLHRSLSSMCRRPFPRPLGMRVYTLVEYVQQVLTLPLLFKESTDSETDVPTSIPCLCLQTLLYTDPGHSVFNGIVKALMPLLTHVVTDPRAPVPKFMTARELYNHLYRGLKRCEPEHHPKKVLGLALYVLAGVENVSEPTHEGMRIMLDMSSYGTWYRDALMSLQHTEGAIHEYLGRSVVMCQNFHGLMGWKTYWLLHSKLPMCDRIELYERMAGDMLRALYEFRRVVTAEKNKPAPVQEEIAKRERRIMVISGVLCGMLRHVRQDVYHAMLPAVHSFRDGSPMGGAQLPKRIPTECKLRVLSADLLMNIAGHASRMMLPTPGKACKGFGTPPR